MLAQVPLDGLVERIPECDLQRVQGWVECTAELDVVIVVRQSTLRIAFGDTEIRLNSRLGNLCNETGEVSRLRGASRHSMLDVQSRVTGPMVYPSQPHGPDGSSLELAKPRATPVDAGLRSSGPAMNDMGDAVQPASPTGSRTARGRGASGARLVGNLLDDAADQPGEPLRRGREQ